MAGGTSVITREMLIEAGMIRPEATATMSVVVAHDHPVLRLDDMGRLWAAREMAKGDGRIPWGQRIDGGPRHVR